MTQKKYSVVDHPRYKEAREASKAWRGWLEKARKKAGMSIAEVLAMSQGNDPYWMTTGKVLKAMWAQDVTENLVKPWLKANGVKQMHLRDIHYTLTRSVDNLTWKGERYLNTDAHWNELIEAFANARYLGLVNWKIIRDNKNDLVIRTNYRQHNGFESALNMVRDNFTPTTIIDKLVKVPFRGMLNVWNFQPVHIEIWAEKDLALLEKVAEDWNINTVTGEGEISITQVYLAADRITDAGKPARIAYISDCDVVGSNMVKAMARKMEFILKQQMGRKGSKLDVRVVPLMATPAQVEELDLPTVPMKSGSQAYDTRVDNWLETRNMDGAVEINSLHSLYPDYFKDTLEEFIRNYIDIGMWNSVIQMSKDVPNWVVEFLDEDLMDLSSLEDMLEAVDWDVVETSHADRVEELGTSDIDYDVDDDKIKWLLNTKLEYGKQLTLYKDFDAGELLKEDNDP